MTAPSETALSAAIQSALETMGAMVVRVQSGTAVGHGGGRMRLGQPGTPDLWFAYREEQGWLEVKTPGGRLSSEQYAWHSKAMLRGVKVHVVRSVEQAVRAVRGAT